MAVQSPTASAAITYSGVDNLVLNGLDGNDAYIVNSTSATNLTQINSGDGNNSLVVNASTRQNTPIEFVGGTANTTIAFNGSGMGDTIVAYNDPNLVQGAHVVGAGLQFQYTTQAQLDSGSGNRLQLASQLTLAENAGNNTIYVLGSVAPTIVHGSSSPGGDNLDLGGNGTSSLPTIAGVTFPGNLSFEDLADFYQPVTVVGSGTDSLTIDDSRNTAESAKLTSTTFSSVKTITYSGISSMNLFLGGGIQTAPGTFSVLDTIGGSGGIKVTPQGGYLDMTISGSETPITINNLGTLTDLTLDARAATSPLSNVQLIQSGGYGEVTGLGPVGNVFFSGLQAADIELGAGSDRMTINENVPATTFQIDGNQGDDYFNVIGLGTGAEPDQRRIGQRHRLHPDCGQPRAGREREPAQPPARRRKPDRRQHGQHPRRELGRQQRRAERQRRRSAAGGWRTDRPDPGGQRQQHAEHHATGRRRQRDDRHRPREPGFRQGRPGRGVHRHLQRLQRPLEARAVRRPRPEYAELHRKRLQVPGPEPHRLGHRPVGAGQIDQLGAHDRESVGRGRDDARRTAGSTSSTRSR